MHIPDSGGGLNPFTGSIIYPLLKNGTMASHVASVRATLADRKVWACKCLRRMLGTIKASIALSLLTRMPCVKPWPHTCRQAAISRQATGVISCGSGYQVPTSCSWQIRLAPHTRSRTLQVCCPRTRAPEHNHSTCVHCQGASAL